MLQRLKAFYRAHKNIWILRTLYCLYAKTVGFCKNTASAIRLLRWKFGKNDAGLPIRVCFLQQDPNCWNKSKALYDLLRSNPRFSVTLLCVPDPFDPDTGSTYRFFAENGYEAVDARIGGFPWSTMENRGDWFDLKALQPDYVFYQQPYDAYLPQAYQSRAVAAYAKLCVTPYGFALTEELLSCMEVDFYRSVYCLYAVADAEKNYNRQRFALSHRLGLRYSKYLGTLVFADFFRCADETSPSWDFSKNGFRAIWTPRWTTDEKIGGSNFFRYKDFLLDYARQHPDVDILFRPHPMAFSNFVRTGLMTQQEVDSYIDKIRAGANTSLDQQKRYDATFWQSDVLITDVSAIIIEYFVTGKPIIFCEAEARACKYLDFFQSILSVCYVAHDQQEISRYLRQLQAGNDPLQPARTAMIQKLFGADLTHTAKAISEDLIRDHSGK